ncbi:hypothetical protein D9M69_377460 [compost metagenome]
MASIMSRIGCSCSIAFSTNTGRAQAAASSAQTSRFSASCQRPPPAPMVPGAPPTARLMAEKKGTRSALRASRYSPR